MFNVTKTHVVQEYLSDPFLIENLKFDFRVYVVLVSLDPLEMYISKEGLARFCTIPYEHPTNRNIGDVYMHLTNYSLNKYSETYLHTESEDDGSKRTMSSVFKKITAKGYDVDKMWDEVKKMVVKTVIAMEGELKVEFRAVLPPHKAGPGCFQVIVCVLIYKYICLIFAARLCKLLVLTPSVFNYGCCNVVSDSNKRCSSHQILGFDVLLTDECKPILLEVNASPSLRIDFDREVAPGIYEHVFSPVDEEIKKPLVFDTLLLVSPKGKKSSK